MLLSTFDLFGTIVFALSGVIMACRLRMDPFGVIVLACVTAVGGGTIRDVILAAPVFWIKAPVYLYVIMGTALVGMCIMRYFSRVPSWMLPVLDAIGLAVFVGIGVEKALTYQDSYFIAVIMGVLTGVGGGIIRDVLAREMPLIFKTEVYATACIAGGCTHTFLLSIELSPKLAFLSGFFTILMIRLAAIRWRLRLPIIGAS